MSSQNRVYASVGEHFTGAPRAQIDASSGEVIIWPAGVNGPHVSMSAAHWYRLATEVNRAINAHIAVPAGVDCSGSCADLEVGQ